MPTILVVDDDPSTRRMLEIMLDDVAEVVACADAESAQAWIEDDEATLPDLAVLDVGLPGMSGLDLLAGWRADPRTSGFQVVLLSGRGAPDDRDAGYQAGADAYIVKPADPEVLTSLIEAMLAAHPAGEEEVLEEFRGLSAADGFD